MKTIEVDNNIFELVALRQKIVAMAKHLLDQSRGHIYSEDYERLNNGIQKKIYLLELKKEIEKAVIKKREDDARKVSSYSASSGSSTGYRYVDPWGKVHTDKESAWRVYNHYCNEVGRLEREKQAMGAYIATHY